MDDYVYNDIINNISQEFERELSKMSAIYNFDLGDEFEIAVCTILRKMLPLKYGVCRGFVVDKSRNAGGDDIIIYDRESFPTLRFLDREDNYAQKNQIPVEAVYAYIEAKHTLDEKTLQKAFNQIIAVKKICYARNHRTIVPVENGQHIFNNEYSREHGWNPIITTPVYTMILSKNCVDTSGAKTASGDAARDFLIAQLNSSLTNAINDAGLFSPDAIIAGNSTTAFCGHYRFDNDGNLKPGIQITRFFTGIKPFSCYQVNANENISYGLAFSHLMMALDFIQLNNMPWDMIFNTGKMPDRQIRNGFLAEL